MLTPSRTLALVFLFCTTASHSPRSRPEHVAPNDNHAAAGHLKGGTLMLALEAVEGRWYPDGRDAAGLDIQAFAQAGRAPQNPGPMIRVRAGTTIEVSVHNALRDSLVVYGLHTRPGTENDTIQVAPGATRRLRFEAGQPGTYFYWGTTTHRTVWNRNGIDSQLQGALIIDPSDGPIRPDRVFVLGSWTGPKDSTGIAPDLRVINGLSWPGTERLSYTAGDTVLWRWVNPTDSPHPMHLHGFYFDVLSRGTWAADTTYAPSGARHVVTEMPVPGETFLMRWVPDEPGNWLVHCHVAYHTSLFLSARVVPDPVDPVAIDHMQGMRGMVLAVVVKPGVAPSVRLQSSTRFRSIRLVAQAAPRRFKGRLDEMAYVSQDGRDAPAADSVPTPSSLLVLRRNEPVRITIVNHLRAETAVHWHGIEVPAYSDGVPSWSGRGSRTAPAIAPGDSFTAAFTPTRSGTFIYHAHSNEEFQINLGLYGALLVVDSGAYQPEHERLIILGSAGPDTKSARINGSLTPDTMRLRVGVPYRLRLIQIIPDWTTSVGLLRGDSLLQWKTLAKDGADLPPSARVMRRAGLLAGPGETWDFEYVPATPGLLRLEVEQRQGLWKTELPIRVDP